MAPILFSIGSVKFYSFGITIIFAWLVYSFLFWRHLRNSGVEDDKIFDLTFFQTITAFIVSRIVYVVIHPHFFSDSILQIAAVWIVPGFSFYAMIVSVVGISTFLSKRLKIRLAYVLDGLGYALPLSLSIGMVGSLLDGSTYGIQSQMAWSVRYVGQAGLRHPIQLYSLLFFVILWFAVLYILQLSQKKKLPYGLVGVWFFLLFGIIQCVVEFFRDTALKIGGLSLAQWILIGIICESVGVLYIKSAGKQKILLFMKEIYDKIPKRKTR